MTCMDESAFRYLLGSIVECERLVTARGLAVWLIKNPIPAPMMVVLTGWCVAIPDAGLQPIRGLPVTEEIREELTA